MGIRISELQVSDVKIYSLPFSSQDCWMIESFLILFRGCSRVIIFGSVWFLLKKVIKSIFFKKTKLVQIDWFRLGFLGQNRFKSVWLGFSGLTRFVSCLARFFSGFFSIWVRFFRFQAYKTKTEPVGFFKILIGFFSRFGFFCYFFSDFLDLIGFSIFF